MNLLGNTLHIVNDISSKIAISIVLILGTAIPLMIISNIAFYFLELYEADKVFMH